MQKVVILLFIPFMFFGQKKYQKNKHVYLNTKETSTQYKIDYTFKNHWNEKQNVSITLNKKKSDNDIQKFGIPKWMFDRYTINSQVELKRAKILKDGLYMKEGENLIADYNAIINYFRGSLYIISDYLIKHLIAKKQDTRVNRIEVAMKFVQDIPYGLPYEYRVPSKYGGYKYDDGIYAPHEVLIKGYGDCDSKTFLFVCILSHMINPNDIIFIKGDNHILSGVKNTKIAGGRYYNYEGEKYYICETAGPGRPLFGKKNTSVGQAYLYPLKIK